MAIASLALTRAKAFTAFWALLTLIVAAAFTAKWSDNCLSLCPIKQHVLDSLADIYNLLVGFTADAENAVLAAAIIGFIYFTTAFASPLSPVTFKIGSTGDWLTIV